MEPSQSSNKKGLSSIIIGIILIVAGIVATLASYHLAKEGGSYSIHWGISAVGLIVLVEGLYKKFKK